MAGVALLTVAAAPLSKSKEGWAVAALVVRLLIRQLNIEMFMQHTSPSDL